MSENTITTILFVDDEEVVGQVTKMMLASLGYGVLFASNGVDAIELYREHQAEISLVILDMVMPEMSGIKCLQKLKEINSGVRVLFTTGYMQENPVKKTDDGACYQILTKPFSREQLADAVGHVLTKPS